MNTNNVFVTRSLKHKNRHYIKFYSVMHTTGVTMTLSLVALVGLTIAPIYRKPNSVNAAIGTATAPTLTFTSANATASVNLAINSADGTFATSTEAEKAAFSISTNNHTGYTLNITASGTTTTLNDSSSHTIASISNTTSLSNFQDTGATGQALNNKWGYIPSYYNSTANTTNYYPAPTSAATATLRVTGSANATDGVSNPDEYTIGLGLRADYTNPSGTYTNSTFLIQYVANTVDYNITYSADNLDGVDGLPATQSGSSSQNGGAENVILSSNIPTRTGYTFVGWCLGTLSNNGTTCTGTTFDAGANFGLDKTTNNSDITLKALWAADTYTTTFTFDNTKGISNIVIKNAASTIATISTTGDSVNLAYGTTYTIVPTIDTSNNYELDAINITSGEGVLSGTDFTSYTVGCGTSTINVTAVKPTTLYDEVASQWVSGGSKIQTNDDDVNTGIQAAISTANSGVFKYDASVFGAASDASSDYDIYYYRGILDSDLDGTDSTYGSNGDGATWPNYVKLGNTCWRIVRTTGSGGIKMIYNGLYSSGTTAGSCANATTDAQTTTSPFNADSVTIGDKTYTGLSFWNMHAIGYTYSNIASNTTTDTTLSTLLGSTGNDTTTNTNSSVIKQYIEDWYTTNLDSYTPILESSAGYCNDRTVYQLNDELQETFTVTPYGTSNMTEYHFGSYVRNNNTTQTPTLNCPRGIVDLYSTTTSNGNGQLAKPVALLTADEASFAGSGSSTASHGSSYHSNSFIHSGSGFWLLSPFTRITSGSISESSVESYGYIGGNYVAYRGYGVRPTISLISGTIATSGSGTATDPWIVAAP